MKYQAEHPEYLSIKISARNLPRPVAEAARRMVNWLAGFSRFNATYAPVIAGGIPDNLGESFLGHIGARVEIIEGGLARIPRTGPVIIVANHPFGVIEGLILNAIVCSVRPDYKCLAAHLLAKLPGLDRNQFVVEPSGKGGKRSMNVAAWHRVFKWLRQGGVFAVFPAGRASHFSWRRRAVTDSPWSRHVGKLVRRSGAPVLPIYFPGRNGLFFQLTGLIHRDLQNTRLIPEFNKMRGRRFRVVIGELIPPDEFAGLDDDQRLIDFLRGRTYALAARLESAEYVQFIGAGKSTIS